MLFRSPRQPTEQVIHFRRCRVTDGVRNIDSGCAGFNHSLQDFGQILPLGADTVLSGKLHISDNINEKLLRTYIENDGDKKHNGIESLTHREKEIFECLGEGLTTRKMAEKFNRPGT